MRWELIFVTKYYTCYVEKRLNTDWNQLDKDRVGKKWLTKNYQEILNYQELSRPKLGFHGFIPHFDGNGFGSLLGTSTAINLCKHLIFVCISTRVSALARISDQMCKDIRGGTKIILRLMLPGKNIGKWFTTWITLKFCNVCVIFE